MNDIGQNGEVHDFEKTFPGCLGRMVNLFELNLGVSKNRLLADRPHRDGSPLSRSSSDVARMSTLGDLKENKVTVSDFHSSYLNRKSNGTPMKMLLAQEMSKEFGSKCNSPNIVAKLMGLETLPTQETDSSLQRVRARGRARSHSDIPMSCWEQQNGFSRDLYPNEFKDIYEILHNSPHMGSFDVPLTENRMALVRWKFAEAKRLSMDEKLRHSKEFQDALEVLNANKGLLLECLQEPNSLLSQDLHNLQSFPPPPGTKRITVLRPSKMAANNNIVRTANKDGKRSEKGAFSPLNGLERGQVINTHPAILRNYENHPQPTRIVVLKPIPVKSHDIRAVGSPQSDSPRGNNGEDFSGDAVNDENEESREVAKAITQRKGEKLGGQHKDKASISSAFSNGYVDDENSFNRSDIEYATGLSESEAMSPMYRHYWDHANMPGSPYSSSSFSRVYYSPESSVSREAKKRLSERWTMMASSGNRVEQKNMRRNSSTLGEMLALSETKKATMPIEEDKLKQKDSNSVIDTELRTPENVNNSSSNLMRSKSVPVSCNVSGVRLNTDVLLSDKSKPEAPKEETKEKQVKSSFKGKVASLFLSRNKKASKDKSFSFETKDELLSETFYGQIGSHENAGLGDEGPEDYSWSLPEPSNKASSSNQVDKLGILSPETGFSEKYIISGNGSENLDQPSPISVLDRPFEEDHTKIFSYYGKPEVEGFELPVNTVGSNFIDKSPLIGSIARTLSWDDSSADSVSSFSIHQSINTKGADEEEQEWLFYVKTLLSTVDLQGEVQVNTFLAKWHSSECPLDPSLRDKYVDLEDKELLHEARRRQRRSTQKLVFDCVDASLVEIAEHGSVLGQRSIQCTAYNYDILENASLTILDEVWTRMNTLFSGGGVKCVLDTCGDDGSLVLESVVRKEVVGKGWIDNLSKVTDNIGEKMEEKLVEELVHEVVVELIISECKNIICC